MIQTNSKFELTPTQKKFFYNPGKRLNFLSGSVRSGKTFVSLIKWALWVGSMPENAEFIMVGKTVTSLKRNCLNLLQELVGDKNFVFSASSKVAVLFGRTVYLEGANDERAENKIRGMTLAGAYCDEITLFPETFVSMLLSRLSMRGAKLWATCNPDSPNHYLKRNFLDNQSLDMNVWNFILTENKFLDPDYIENITKEYHGVQYQRFILGRWVRAEGVIYEKFADDSDSFIIDSLSQLSRKILFINIGVDFGGSGSATTFVCTGITQGFKELVVLESERIEKYLDPIELEKLFVEFLHKVVNQWGRIQYVWCDSAEQILIRGLKRAMQKAGVGGQLQNALKSKINDRINLTNKLIASDRLKIVRHCKTIVNALKDAVWEDGKESRLDNGTSDIDTLDAFEYSFERYAKQLLDYVLAR